MEAIFSYFLKSNGLLIIFFLSYYFLLRKETFFNNNRWFLLLGLFASVLLPLITFTKTVWIEPTPFVYESVSSDFVPFIIENEAAEQPIDWNSILFYVYIGISVVLIVKILIEIFSFFRIIQFGKKTRTKEALLIDNLSNENPFSFFKHIVFNSQMFTEEELQHIISHENIHVKEKHSIDVLIAKIFCAVFWMNPIMWFYKKEMLQNLEYIADNKAVALAQNKINYQKTLLKVVTNQHQLSITNQFYQSLIKKRIVMLNTNPSNQKKSWKYALILPVLSAFMLLFQIETVAQVKEEKIEKTTEIKADTILWVKDFKDEFDSKMDVDAVFAAEVIQFIINKNTTDVEIEKETKKLKEEYNIKMNISKVKRNKQNEIIALNAKFEDENNTSGHISIKSNEPIKPIRFFKELGDNGNIGFDRNDTTTFFKNKNSKEVGIQWKDAVKLSNNSKSNRLYIINGKEYSDEGLKNKFVTLDGSIESKEDSKTKKRIMIFNGNSTISDDEEKTTIFLNEKEISKEEMDKINPITIKTVNVNKNNDKDEIKIITKNSAGVSDDVEIYINGKKSSKADLDKIQAEEIETINVTKNEHLKKIEIQKKKMAVEIEKVKEKIEKAKIEMELKAQQNSKLSREELEERKKMLEERRKDKEKLIEERKKMLEERKKEMEEQNKL